MKITDCDRTARFSLEITGVTGDEAIPPVAGVNRLWTLAVPPHVGFWDDTPVGGGWACRMYYDVHAMATQLRFDDLSRTQVVYDCVDFDCNGTSVFRLVASFRGNNWPLEITVSKV